MAELLLELFSEEIPARMQWGAAEQLKEKATAAFKSGGVAFKSIETYVTPRRLVLVADGLPKQQEDLKIEHKGPSASAPAQAIEGFLKKTGLKLEQLEKRATDKGDVYFATIEQKGKATAEILPALLEEIVTNFHWPKSMRWSDHSFRWVRPLKNIAALFDGKILPLTVAHLKSNDTSYGHRFLAPDAFKVKDFAGYKAELEKRFVILDAVARAKTIMEQATKLVEKKGLVVHQDDKLLEEVSGLAEWPVVLLGEIEERFLKLPQEVLMTSMRSHQKYFSVVDKKGKIAPHYIVVTNMKTDDNGKQILDGNGRVLRARLSDAEFFYAQDKKQKLEAYLAGLKGMVFHAKLGTMEERVNRIVTLSKTIAPLLKADAKQAERAAKLAKADLSSNMVGEFPELQGIMGAYYAAMQGEDAPVVDAIREHYSPLGPSDDCPTAPVSVAVALADKLDTLAGMFAIGETPTGSKDPFALRRAALGIIRLILENNLSLPLKKLFDAALANFKQAKKETSGELISFFEDRLKAALKAKGTRHDLITAVFAKGEDDLLLATRRVEALDLFLSSENGKNLLAAYKRAANILAIEEKKDNTKYEGAPKADIAEVPEEKALITAFDGVTSSVDAALGKQDFTGAMKQLAGLRQPVDAFFDKVKVNADNQNVRVNRLKILSNFRGACDAVAIFAHITE